MKFAIPEMEKLSTWARKVRLQKCRAKVACLEPECSRCRRLYPNLQRKMAELRVMEAEA